MTAAQRAALEALVAAGDRGLTARAVARVVWPEDAGWDRWTAGRGASRHNGARGATMPLRAGRVLRALEDAGLASRDLDRGPRAGLWTITVAGSAALA